MRRSGAAAEAWGSGESASRPLCPEIPMVWGAGAADDRATVLIAWGSRELPGLAVRTADALSHCYGSSNNDEERCPFASLSYNHRPSPLSLCTRGLVAKVEDVEQFLANQFAWLVRPANWMALLNAPSPLPEETWRRSLASTDCWWPENGRRCFPEYRQRRR